MSDRIEQIEMLNQAKADVQSQLDALFEDESASLSASIACLSQIDPEKMAQFLARATYESFNVHSDVVRSKLVDRFSSVFGNTTGEVPSRGGPGWRDDNDGELSCTDGQTPTEAA